MDKIDAYRSRRDARMNGRMDDEGRWITTKKKKRKVHLNEEGVPDKGNPFIIAKMTGTKPKLSSGYRTKSLKEHLGRGKSERAVHALKDLPEGSKITTGAGTVYTKTGSGFVSSKGKSGVKQTPQALTRILSGHVKAGKDFTISYGEETGSPVTKTSMPATATAATPTGAPKPGETGVGTSAPDSTAVKPEHPGISRLKSVIDSGTATPDLLKATMSHLPESAAIDIDGVTYHYGSDTMGDPAFLDAHGESWGFGAMAGKIKRALREGKRVSVRERGGAGGTSATPSRGSSEKPKSPATAKTSADSTLEGIKRAIESGKGVIELKALPLGTEVIFSDGSTWTKESRFFKDTKTGEELAPIKMAGLMTDSAYSPFGKAFAIKRPTDSAPSVFTDGRSSEEVLRDASKKTSASPSPAKTYRRFGDKHETGSWGTHRYAGSGKETVDFFKKVSNFDNLISHMTSSQRSSFESWTQGYFMSGQQYRGWDGMSKTDQKITKDMDDILDRATLDEGITVHRLATAELVLGVGRRTATLEELQAMRGKSVTSKGAMSCGAAAEGLTIGSRSKEVEYRISIPGGSTGAGMWIGDKRINGWAAEQREFVMNRDTEYTVGETTFDSARGVYVVELEYTGRQPHDYGKAGR